MNAGAVVLTDCVFWFIIVPFLTRKDYDLNFVSFFSFCLLLYMRSLRTSSEILNYCNYTLQLLISMHSINVVFLLGEAALNSLVSWNATPSFKYFSSYSFQLESTTFSSYICCTNSFQRFPWFRIAYFFLWTTVYVVFQWILHSAHSTW